MISIIIPSLDEGEFLPRTIQSIYANTTGEFEVIIIDDASTDGTRERMKGCKYSNLVYYRNNKRVGLIHSRILGSTLARGTYLMFMDAHCNPELGWERALLEALRKCDDRAITAPIISMLDPVSWRNDLHQYGKAMSINEKLDMLWYDTVAMDLDDTCYQSPIFSGIFLVSRNFYEEIGGLDEGLSLWGGENIDLSIRCWMWGEKVLIVKSSIIGHVFKSRFPYELTYGTVTRNKLRLAYVNFSNERFQRVARCLTGIERPDEHLIPDFKSAEQRRLSLIKNRYFDDDWYMQKFDIEI